METHTLTDIYTIQRHKQKSNFFVSQSIHRNELKFNDQKFFGLKIVYKKNSKFEQYLFSSNSKVIIVVVVGGNGGVVVSLLLPMPLESVPNFIIYAVLLLVYSNFSPSPLTSLFCLNSVACFRIHAIILTSYVNCFNTFISRFCVIFFCHFFFFQN